MTKTQNPPKTSYAFFGTSHIAVYVLEALEAGGSLPDLIVTLPPKPKGRGLEAQPTDVEVWARERALPLSHDWKAFEAAAWDVAVVVDYGIMLPNNLLEVPRCGFLNVHPSLLPRLRGASPMRSAILHDEKDTGVTVMLVSEGMDEGPVVAQKKVDISGWPVGNTELERILMTAGGTLLAQVLPLWVRGEIEAQPQNHDVATYSKKLSKEDGLLDLSADGYTNLLKIRALEGWPGTYAFFERAGKTIRVQILAAHLAGNKLVIEHVKPEGKKEMGYEEFLRSGARPTLPPNASTA